MVRYSKRNIRKQSSQSTIIQNWMKTVEYSPAVVVNVTSVQEVQQIVRNEIEYPSPVRAAGNILSPSAVHSNTTGTTVVLRLMKTIATTTGWMMPGARWRKMSSR